MLEQLLSATTNYFAYLCDTELEYENMVGFFAMYPNIDHPAHLKYV